jgi:pilus assembly protein FimV
LGGQQPISLVRAKRFVTQLRVTGRLCTLPSRFASVTPAASATAFILSVVCATPASALSLGAERVISYLGQPLRVEIPIDSAAGSQWDASCFALVAPARRDGTPIVRQGRLEVSADNQRLILRTFAAADEPALRFAVDVGCDTKLRREFTVLLDPAPVLPAGVTPPSVAETRPTTVEPSVATGSAQPTTSAASAKASDTTPRSSRASTPRPTSEARQPTPTKSRATQSRADGDSRLVLKGSDATIDAASLAALAVPRLRISGDLPAWSVGDPNNPNAPLPGSGVPLDELSAAIANERRARLAAAPIDEDLPARLEADLIVAKKRLAEAQAQLAAASLASSGASAPIKENPKKSTSAPDAPVNQPEKAAAVTSFDWRDWVWIPALAVVLGLLGFLWRQRRTQRAAASSQWSAVDSVTVVHGEPTAAVNTSPARPVVPPYDSGEATIASPPTVSDVAHTPNTIAEASERLESPLFSLSQTASSLDVSELSHITDEAQVYADLGRTNEAIEILGHHIDSYDGDRPSPAPWLMLFDLFRKASRRADYDRLAPMFRKRFNGRLPEWDEYGSELALDDGLEAFPHLIARIERDWGTPAARGLLDELLYDNRGGSRLGFSLSAYRDLLMLLQVHDQLAAEGKLDATRPGHESPGANDDDGTPKWELSLETFNTSESSEVRLAPHVPDLDEFLNPKK